MESEDEEESEEEDRDKDVDPGFRQQLMQVLQAGNALVSSSQGRKGFVCLPRARLMAVLLCLRVEWTMRTMRRSLGMRP